MSESERTNDCQICWHLEGFSPSFSPLFWRLLISAGHSLAADVVSVYSWSCKLPTKTEKKDRNYILSSRLSKRNVSSWAGRLCSCNYNKSAVNHYNFTKRDQRTSRDGFSRFPGLVVRAGRTVVNRTFPRALVFVGKGERGTRFQSVIGWLNFCEEIFPTFPPPLTRFVGVRECKDFPFWIFHEARFVAKLNRYALVARDSEDPTSQHMTTTRRTIQSRDDFFGSVRPKTGKYFSLETPRLKFYHFFRFSFS